jgi:hypothetical protein
MVWYFSAIFAHCFVVFNSEAMSAVPVSDAKGEPLTKVTPGLTVAEALKRINYSGFLEDKDGHVCGHDELMTHDRGKRTVQFQAAAATNHHQSCSVSKSYQEAFGCDCSQRRCHARDSGLGWMPLAQGLGLLEL